MKAFEAASGLCGVGLRRLLLVTFGVLLLFAPLRTSAQALSGINGTITDATGGAVPDATVTVTNVDTNVSRTATSTSAGTYFITDLIPGTYTVKVQKAGFEIFTQKGVAVVGGATSTANAVLTTGAVTQEVVVVAPSVALQTEQPEVGTTVSETLTENLPQLISGENRQIDQFIFLTPGVTGGGFSHRIDGGVDQQTEILFNGVPEAFSETQGLLYWNQPPYDSIKDVDVLSGTFSAQYGLGQGVEQYHSKSGGNTIHGDGFYFYRDDALLGAPGASLDLNPNNKGVVDSTNTNIQSDLGGSVGGPVYIPHVYDGRNKFFWFFSYDRYRQSFTNDVVTVPTPAELGGDFSQAFNPTSPTQVIPVFVPISWASNPSLIPSTCTVPGSGPGSPGTQWPGNKIPTSCFSQESQALLSAYKIPAPSNSNLIDNYVPTTIALNLQTDYAVSSDYNLTKNQAIHGLYWRQYYPQPNGEDWVNNPLSNENITTTYGRGVDITYSNAISSHMVLTGGFLYVYQRNDFQPPHILSTPIPPVPASGLAQPLTFPSLSFTGGLWEPWCCGNPGGFGWGPGNGLSSTINHKTGFSETGNLLWITGRHNLNIGIDVRHTHQDDFECGGSGGQPGCSGLLNFTSDVTADPTEATPGATTGIGFASFLLGDATTGGRGGAGNTNLRNNYVAPYVQDNIQINPKLKINAGIRWDLAFPFTNDFGTNQLTFFDPNVPNPTEISPLTGNPLMGAMAEQGTCSVCVGWSTMNMQWKHFSPRLGFTYQLNPKTVILGGASFYWLDTGAFEYGVNKVAVNYGNNLNGVVSIGQPAPQIPGFGQWDTSQLPPLPATGFSPTFFNGVDITGYAQVHTMPRSVNQAYDEQFVIGVQRELPFSMFLSASYVHTHDIHLPATLESGLQDLSYNFIQSTCPQGPAVTNTLDCVLAQPWTSGAAQTFMASQGTFGQVTYAPGTCGNSSTVSYYAPYVNFCAEHGAGDPLFTAELPFPQMPFVTNNFDTSGADEYNALQTSLQKRTGSGLTFLVSYTLSRYYTNTDSGFSTFNGRGLNPQNPNAEWSVGSADQTHVLTIAGVYELPIGPGKKFFNHGGMAMKNLLGGWKISWVQWYESGPPVNLVACGNQFDCDPLIGNYFVGDRPNVLNNNFNVDWNNYYKSLATYNTGSPTSYPVFNTSSFQYPGSWTIGNGPVYYNSIRYPWYLDEDAAFTKRFFFGERVNADFTVQWFNLFNRNLLSNGPGGGVNCFHNNIYPGVTNFGTADSSPSPFDSCQGNTPRRGQFQLQVNF